MGHLSTNSRSRSLLLGCFTCCIACLSIGCTHSQLRYSSARQGSTLTDIQYRQVLDNIAMFVNNPGALPYFAISGAGSAQVTDTGGLNALTFNWPSGGQASLIGTRAVAEQWGLSPILQPDRLKAMQCAYQMVTQSAIGPCLDCETVLNRFVADFDPGCDVPVGWFCVGTWSEVPKGAEFGCHKGTYVWVPASGVDELSRFTLTILSIATCVPSTEKKVLTRENGVTEEVLSSEPRYEIPRVPPAIQFFPQSR